jgi:hypothetical protein
MSINTVSGQCKLYIIIDFIKYKFYEEINYHTNEYLFSKLNDEAMDYFLKKTIIFHTNMSALKESQIASDFNKYKNKIIAIENFELMVFLVKYKKKLDDLEVNWIIMENNLQDIKEFSIFNVLNKASIFEYYRLEIDKNSKQNFRIDFDKFEHNVEQKHDIILNKFLKYSRKYFFNSLFNLSLNKIKINQPSKVATLKFEPINYKDIKLVEEDFMNVYVHKCVLCGAEDRVLLSSSKKNINRKNKYKLSSDIIVKNNEQSVEIKCDHINIENFENVLFIFNNPSEELKEFDVDKLFIYYLKSFKLTDDNKILFYKDDKLATIQVDKFIKSKYAKRSR